MEKHVIYNPISEINHKGDKPVKKKTDLTKRQKKTNLHHRFVFARQNMPNQIKNKNHKNKLCIHNEYDRISSSDVNTNREYKIKNTNS